MSKLMGWIAGMPSTNLTIAVGLVLAILFTTTAMVAALLTHPIDEATLNTVGLFITGMMGIGAGQFGLKRITDTGLAAAKAGAAPPVTINAPANQTNVQAPPASGNAG